MDLVPNRPDRSNRPEARFHMILGAESKVWA